MKGPPADEDGGSGAPGGVHRSICNWDADEVNQCKAQTYGKRSEALRRAFVGCSKNDQQKKRRQNHFRDEACQQGIASWRVESTPIRREASGQRELRFAARDHIEDARAGDHSKNLRNNVGGKLDDREPLADNQADRDCKVEMRTGDVPNGEGHADDGQTKGERHTNETDTQRRIGRGENGTTATLKNQPKSSKQLRDCPLGHVGVEMMVRVFVIGPDL